MISGGVGQQMVAEKGLKRWWPMAFLVGKEVVERDF